MKTKLVKVTKSQKLKVTTDTQFVLLVTNYFSQSETVLELNFTKPGVTAEIILVYDVPVKGSLNVTTVAKHVATNTSCLTKVRGILNDKTTCNYIGKIIIEKSAQQTSSFLQDDVLVVGQNTKNNSQPILMIEANDVKASHGATTGRINEEEIYYLQSRGFARNEAEKLVTEGFLSGLLSQVVDQKIGQQVAKVLGVS